MAPCQHQRGRESTLDGEWLTSALDLRPGMRILDLGCGRASSSIFLHREFGVQVWATDLWFSAAENGQRIRDAGVEDGVFPMHADARSLPFSDEFFDVIVSLDSFSYYGTDDLYLNYLAQFVNPGGAAERHEEIFDLRHPSPFMLLAAEVRVDWRNRLAAIVHVDGSARPQTVSKDTNALYYELIQRFEQLSGLPVVLNTSFNHSDEPLVNSPGHAISTFYRTGIDTLVIGNYIVRKRHN